MPRPAPIDRPPRRRIAAAIALGSALVVGASSWGASGRQRGVVQLPRVSLAEVEAACAGPNPFVAAAVYAHSASPAAHRSAPALIAFRDTVADDPTAQPILATQAEIGAVLGLAYDAGRHQIYAAAYHRRGSATGPGGPGQIYRIDLASGGIEAWATLDAGPDRHAPDPRDDPQPSQFVGVTGLGDIELDDSGTVLAVTNLFDRRIYRLSVPDGRIMGSFAHGADRTRWARNARPFGLGTDDGWLYHGVIDSREFDTLDGTLSGHVYRSRWDGADMTEVAAFPLAYPLARWWPWTSLRRNTPMLADLEFDQGDNLIVGIRNRWSDANDDSSGHFLSRNEVGSVLWGQRNGDAFDVRVDSTHYAIGSPKSPNHAWGTLASIPGLDTLVVPIQFRGVAGHVEAQWLDNPSGSQVGFTRLFDVTSDSAWTPAVFGAGDLEVLCPARPGIDPDLVATATAEALHVATATAQTATADAIRRQTEEPPTGAARATIAAATAAVRATQAAEATAQAAATATGRVTANVATATALAPTLQAAAPTRTAAGTLAAGTMTAMVPALTAQATLRAARMTAAATQMAASPATLTPAAATAAAVRGVIRGACGTGNPYLAVTCFMPARTVDGTPIADAVRAGAPVVAAFNDTRPEDPTRHVPLANDLQLGAVFGMAWDDARGHLYVAAYQKRLTHYGPLGPGGIYRIDLGTGRVEPFAWLAMGLPRHDEDDPLDRLATRWIGKAALGDIEIAEGGDVLLAVNLEDRLIYRIRLPDGQILGAFPHGAVGEPWAAEARPFGLGFRDGWLYHGVVDGRAGSSAVRTGMKAHVYRSRDDGTAMQEVAEVPLDYARDVPWSPWTDGTTTGRDPTGVMLTDIEFLDNGDLVLGLRDRQADSGLLASSTASKGQGDMLPVRMVGANTIVSTALEPSTDHFGPSGGALWFSGEHGAIVGEEVVYTLREVEFAKDAGLGDIEALCPLVSSTATSMPSPSPSPSPSGSPTPSPSPTIEGTATAAATATATGMLRPGHVYLPIVGDVAMESW